MIDLVSYIYLINVIYRRFYSITIRRNIFFFLKRMYLQKTTMILWSDWKYNKPDWKYNTPDGKYNKPDWNYNKSDWKYNNSDWKYNKSGLK